MEPTDANFTGTVFGGEILAKIDPVAYFTATRHSKLTRVTTSFDRVNFLSPVHDGQIVEFDAALTSVGRSSMEISVEVRTEGLKQGRSRFVGRAFVSMVGVDERSRPEPIPPLELTNEDERRLFEEGRQRMEARRHSRTRDVGV